ncbi:MAG: hypothetical protein WDW38_000629 [Sanguina aurantia]
MAAGNGAALSILSWEGWCSSLLGNLLMSCHFATRGERSAVMVQLLGVANNLIVLTQIALAQLMPHSVYAASVALSVVALFASLHRLSKPVQSSTSSGTSSSGGGGSSSSSSSPTSLADTMWRCWQLGTGLLGFAVLPQVGPSQSRQTADATADQIPGWSATLLFALSPLPQLARNFQDPGSLAGLSVLTMLLALAGNMMMVPRALFTRDTTWTVGSGWAVATGWVAFLSLFLGTSVATGLRYIELPAFMGISVTLAIYLAYILTSNNRVQQLKQQLA